MARDNPLWGTERIRGELLKLDIIVSSRSIRRYRRQRHSRPPSQSWRTFLANHSQAIWAADLFVVQTLTFQTLYVLFFISHGSRQLLHFEVSRQSAAGSITPTVEQLERGEVLPPCSPRRRGSLRLRSPSTPVPR
jgi:hypothetical protein